VILLLVVAAFVVVARVRLWPQTVAPDRVIRLFAWALVGVFLLEALASITYNREYEWWLYGPGGLVIGLLALLVAGSGGAWPIRRPHRSLPPR
jgi:hypothetical protein